MYACIVLNTYTNYMQLKELGFNLDRVKYLSNAHAFLCYLDTKTVLGIPDNYSTPHQPMVAIEHVAPLLLLQDSKARFAYLEEVSGVKLSD